MKEKKCLIWSNVNLNYEDYRKDLEAEYPSPKYTDDERYIIMLENNDEQLNDERVNLNIHFLREKYSENHPCYR